ncbi:MAG: radical protein, partial [Rhodospirillales bacterium]|nr:radical protein [Rhodospirillales bacterium]
MADIVLINPRFDPSYWGLEHALPVLGAKAVLSVACLPLLAALTPASHRVTIIDENIEPIDFDRCARADIVGVTGMIVQRTRMTAILSALKERGVLTVVGGPWISVQEDYFGALADVVFVGEAEDTWPRFLAEWASGQHGRRYEQAERTDMSTVPAPRFDLLAMSKYAFGSVQISRGCPFACEFCDIIVVFGRRPRIKTSAQVIAELDALLAHGKRDVFIVDDNLIGNKKAIKAVLNDLAAWQRAKGFAMRFFTEASIDLADDAELMQLMVDVNIDGLFVGIETPNDAALRETKKFQNVRSGGTMVEKVHRIQNAGMEVWSGMILGFDNDDASIFEAQRRFIREARIVHAMVG